MTFLEAMYRGQYYEIHQKGKDGKKGRLNANLFLSALIILFIFVVIIICITFVPGFNKGAAKSIEKIFGYSSGRSIGKLLAIPLFALILLQL